jgi:hypothetical protein
MDLKVKVHRNFGHMGLECNNGNSNRTGYSDYPKCDKRLSAYIPGEHDRFRRPVSHNAGFILHRELSPPTSNLVGKERDALATQCKLSIIE